MFQIGEFSRLGRVTIDTLRHYDSLDLLKPAKVDAITGYRYYKASQLQTLNRIIALKEIGFSLEEISRILQDNLTTEELRGMLKAQLVLTESAIETAQLRREKIQTRLKHLTLEENKLAADITIKPVDELTIASIREIVSSVEQIPQRMVEMFNAIDEWAKNNNLVIGIPLTMYHDECYSRENIDTECAFTIPNIAINKLPKPAEPIVIRQMKAVSQAATIVDASFQQKPEGLTPAYQAIGQWIVDHNYRITDSPRELYYGSPQTGDFTAEIQFPVEKI